MCRRELPRRKRSSRPESRWCRSHQSRTPREGAGPVDHNADGPSHGPVSRQAPELERDRTPRAGCRPTADDNWIGRVVRPLQIVGGQAVRVDGRVLASRIPADGVRMLVTLVDLQAGPARGVEHRRGGGANTAAHCTGVIAQAADDDAAQDKTMRRIDRADSTQEAELLAPVSYTHLRAH